MKYKRVLLKLSGESLMGDKQFGIDNKVINEYAAEIKQLCDANVLKWQLLLEVEIFSEEFRLNTEVWTELRGITWVCWQL
jgi:hypothetical protein